MNDITWSPQQDDALKAVSRWLKEPRGPQVFRLFGYAGTGKTTLARYFAGEIAGTVLYGAFTGKAASVMRQKGCVGAATIHSMIYTPIDEGNGITKFTLKADSEVESAALVIIDECSMVGEELGRDLLSYGTKVLVLGDPAQLPPVKSAGFFTNAKPDVLLTEIHRQAAENPIIRLSMDVREGKPIEFGDFGQVQVISRNDVDAQAVIAADIVLVGMNRTRQAYNRRIRELKGIASSTPIIGEKLVCLRNRNQKGLLNGTLWTVERVRRSIAPYANLVVAPEDDPETKAHVEVQVNTAFFVGGEDDLDAEDLRRSDHMGFGYALTVHKAQGSQWEEVVLFDESGVFKSDARRWLYTGLTRAAERITIVRNAA